MSRRVADRHARELLVGPAAGHLYEILPILLFGVRTGQDIERLLVHCPHAARVTAVAAAKVNRRRFDDQHVETACPGAERCAKSGVAAADDQQIVRAKRIQSSSFWGIVSAAQAMSNWGAQ